MATFETKPGDKFKVTIGADGSSYRKCPECAMHPDEGHSADCLLVIALRKAGVR